jgi:hypothetical protein
MNSREGVVLDTKTDLMWASTDSEAVDWASAKRYCENYSGGGYADWPMPMQDELAKLYAGKAHQGAIRVSDAVWASETRDSHAASFNFILVRRAGISRHTASALRLFRCVLRSDMQYRVIWALYG